MYHHDYAVCMHKSFGFSGTSPPLLQSFEPLLQFWFDAGGVFVYDADRCFVIVLRI